MAMRRATAAPACPRHPESRVWFDGTYGKPGHRRQRFKCLPADGDPSHRFTETLPRQHTASGECVECERPYARYEGPTTPRLFDFTTREIASALIAVGRGESYRRAGLRVRERASRLRHSSTGALLRNDDGNTVADWVELFAPVVFCPRAPSEWPRIVALDALPFRVADANEKGHPKQGGVPAFHVFGAYGWDTRGRGRLLALKAYPGFKFNQGTPHWIDFLLWLSEGLDGAMPFQIVCDPDRDVQQAIARVWPPEDGRPLTYFCHWHLRERALAILRQRGVAADDPLYEAAQAAFHSTMNWQAFEQLASERKLKDLDAWRERYRERITWQVAHQAGRRVSVGPLEQVFVEVRNRLEDRRGRFKNRERLNRLLLLIQLDLSKRASEGAYTKLIREHLLARDGRSHPRRAILDPLDQPSLST